MKALPRLRQEQVRRSWFACQGLSLPRGSVPFSRAAVTDHLERAGALQLDSIHVIDRAHWITLWSRFDRLDRGDFERWIYEEKLGYEYWGHEASILPRSHLTHSRRRMKDFPHPTWAARSWWKPYQTSPASQKRVLSRIREEGPLESAHFEEREGEWENGRPGGAMPFSKEDARSMRLLWHAGKLGVKERRHFRRVYDLAANVYPQCPPARAKDTDHTFWTVGLRGNGVAPEAHLLGYWTAVCTSAAERASWRDQLLRRRALVEVAVEGRGDRWFTTPEHLVKIDSLPEPRGTNLLCPFDSFLWQRKRAEELLGFRYRVEIYIPPAKREHGYYVLPILHDGRLVGRLDPKLHRDRGELEIRSLKFEPGFRRTPAFARGLSETLHSLREFLGAEKLRLPKGVRGIG